MNRHYSPPILLIIILLPQLMFISCSENPLVIEPGLSLNPSSLGFDSLMTNLEFGISNTGPGNLTWSISSDRDWIIVDPTSGSTSTETYRITVTVDRAGLGSGTYHGTVNVASNGGNASVIISAGVDQTLETAWAAIDPILLESLVWEGEEMQLQIGYANWDSEVQYALRRAFANALNGKPSLLSDPVANLANRYNAGSWPSQWISLSDALLLYTEYVGYTLAVEVENRVPWSILDYTPSQLEMLLSSRHMFHRSRSQYIIREVSHLEDHGRVTPATAEHAWEFMQDKIGQDRIETIGNLLEWLRRAVHYSGGFTYDNYENHWQYPGYPPVIRIIEGTTRLSDGIFRHYAPGCHGTYGFLRTLLKVVNIPVYECLYHAEGRCIHASPYFPVDEVVLSHGDDPYSGLCRYEDYPGTELLVDATTFDYWSNEGNGSPVGRRVRELAITYLPVPLLRYYCQDIEAGLSHEEGSVVQGLVNWTVPELEALTLWTRMDQKLQSRGGCENITSQTPDENTSSGLNLTISQVISPF
jgi:hypothetical protein